jgi:CRP/FNR family transcriptional regulator, cyclic AMP receptor protein
LPQTLEPLLRRHEFFAGLDPQYLALLTGCAANVTFAGGAFLFRQGTPAEKFFLITGGTVALEIAAPSRVVTVQTLGEGEVAGFSWLMGPHQWQFDGRAVTRVRAIEMDGACLRAKCEADPRLGFDLMRRFASVAMRRLQATRLQIMDVYGHANLA